MILKKPLIILSPVIGKREKLLAALRATKKD